MKTTRQTILSVPFQAALRLLPVGTRAAFRLFFLLACLLTIAALPAQAQEPQRPGAQDGQASAPAGGGSITGRVSLDDGRPAEGVGIFAYRAYAGTPAPPLTTGTDDNGRFRLPDVPPGFYTVRVLLPGYVQLSRPDAEPGESGYIRPGDSLNITLVKGGVVTGTVKDSDGGPLVAVPVRAVRVRDAEGRSTSRSYGFIQEHPTDDRGIYRIYGLEPGAYILIAGGSRLAYNLNNAADAEAPTYYPSSTREGATEINVRSNDEVTGIDIRYRGERGRVINGTVSGVNDPSSHYTIFIMLTQAASGAVEATTFTRLGGKQSFSLAGLADGEYELTAQYGVGAGDTLASVPRRVTVRGADVEGIQLTLSPLASIAGRVVLDPAPPAVCKDKSGSTLQDILVTARRDEKETKEASRVGLFTTNGSIPEALGDFNIRTLLPGSYRLDTRLPVETWYVRALTAPDRTLNAPGQALTPQAGQARAAETKTDAARPLLTLKMGERVTGLTLNVAQDGASLRGRVLAEAAAPLPRLRVYLLPTEKERAADTLRYAEAPLKGDGTFAFNHLAPGRYWLIARPAPADGDSDKPPRPLARDADARAALRREAEKANALVDLQPCRRTDDYVLRYPARPAEKE
ncbi:MAG TPA: carboxypeptidase-like regulatory domain-containing protein [Pyrinomonadaceae bacterium]|jgi:hypothetical protein